MDIEETIANLRDEHNKYEDHENFKDWITRKMNRFEVRLEFIEKKLNEKKP
jgi:hypothetical protein|tara:strand:+ start:17 stop:169 length:153 start_codon:yes stop_codon:yes gene_type:complete